MSIAETLAVMPAEQLIDLVRRGLDDDEEAARAATRGPWWVDTPSAAWGEDVDPRVSAVTGEVATLPHHLNGGLNALHVERHDPARVLRDADSRRRTLVRCEEELLSGIPRLVHFAQETLRDMARPYLDQETP